MELLMPNATQFTAQTGRAPPTTAAASASSSPEVACDIDPNEALIDPRGLHIWPRGSHFLMGLPNQDGSFTMTLYLPDTAVGDQPGWDQINSDQDVRFFF
jgi:hypothetical protein